VSAKLWRVGLAVLVLTAFILLTAGPKLVSRDYRRVGRLVPRQTMMTWKSPTASGPFGSERAELSFVLDNVGGQAVRIQNVQTDCSCMKPVADPLVVQPGGVTKIVVKAMTPVSGRSDVPILIHTDSQTSPEIRLTARIVSGRRPPFVYSVTGDLHFRGVYSPDLARDLVVVTFETPGPTVEPVLSSDLPFLKMENVGVSEKTNDDESFDGTSTPVGNVVVRTRRYRVGFKEKPPEPSCSGTVKVADPFHNSGDRKLGVVCNFRSPSAGLQVFPRLLTLSRQKGASGNVVVLCDQPAGRLDCAVEKNRISYASIQMETNSNPRKVHKIQVRVEDTSYQSEEAIRFTVRDPRTKANETFLVRFGEQ